MDSPCVLKRSVTSETVPPAALKASERERAKSGISGSLRTSAPLVARSSRKPLPFSAAIAAAPKLTFTMPLTKFSNIEAIVPPLSGATFFLLYPIGRYRSLSLIEKPFRMAQLVV